jgi:aspartate racemase
MRGVGLLGCDSTNLCHVYERHFGDEVGRRYGPSVSPNIVTLNIPWIRLIEYEDRDEAVELGKTLRRGIAALQDMGAEAILVCSSWQQSRLESTCLIGSLQLMADVVAPAVATIGYRRVGVMGAIDEIEEAFWRRRFRASNGCEALFPVPADRAHLVRIVSEELALGIVSESSRIDLLRVAYGLREAGARALVSLRPELSRVFETVDSLVPVLDAVELHALAVVDWSLGKPDQVPPFPGPQPTERNTPIIEK